MSGSATPLRGKWSTIAIVAIIALIMSVVLRHTIGMAWAFVWLFALWVSGHMVAWFKRHPPPPY